MLSYISRKDRQDMKSLIAKAGLIIGLLALVIIPRAASAEGVTLVPEQPSVAAGKTIYFTGAGFIEGERVVTWATAPDQAVLGGDYAAAKGSSGKVEVGFTVPKNAIGGQWALTAYGLESQTPVVATFEVQGRPAETASPQGMVAPQSGPPGTRFAFAALGFKSKETVSYWLTGPDGQVHAAYPEGETANSDGRVDITWDSPADAPRGVWVITIQGLKSDVARGIPF